MTSVIGEPGRPGGARLAAPGRADPSSRRPVRYKRCGSRTVKRLGRRLDTAVTGTLPRRAAGREGSPAFGRMPDRGHAGTPGGLQGGPASSGPAAARPAPGRRPAGARPATTIAPARTRPRGSHCPLRSPYCPFTLLKGLNAYYWQYVWRARASGGSDGNGGKMWDQEPRRSARGLEAGRRPFATALPLINRRGGQAPSSNGSPRRATARPPGSGGPGRTRRWPTAGPRAGGARQKPTLRYPASPCRGATAGAGLPDRSGPGLC